MYHYVRKRNINLPNFRYLDIDDFCKQINYFKKNYFVHNYDSFLETIKSKKIKKKSLVLTFDDGFKDHYENVMGVLNENNMLGIFYVSTKPYQQKESLDVHKIQYLVGKVPISDLTKELNILITDNMLSEKNMSRFSKVTYKMSNDEDKIVYFKKFLNYYIKYEYRGSILLQLVSKFSNESEILNELYMSESELIELKSNHIIGSHSVNHYVFSKLSAQEQEIEIKDSFSYIENILGRQELKTFCYPYGGFHSFNSDTEKILDSIGCDFSFNVESRNINNYDLNQRAQALPRFNCNEFPYGKARLG